MMVQKNSLILIMDPIDPIRPAGHPESMPIGGPQIKA